MSVSKSWSDYFGELANKRPEEHGDQKFIQQPVPPEIFFRDWMGQPLFPEQLKPINAMFSPDFQDMSSEVNELLLMYGEGCLLAGTMIKTYKGMNVPIESLYNKPATRVICMDKDGKKTVGMISQVRIAKMVFEVCHVSLNTGETFTCTPEHRVLTAKNEWKEAYKLIPNELLADTSFPMSEGWKLKVKEVKREKLAKSVPVYDFTVASHENVSLACGAVVHNSGKDFLCERMLIYVAYWLLCLKSPQEYLGRADGTPIDLVNTSVNEEHASNVFFKQFCDALRIVINPKSGKNWFEEQGMDLREGKDILISQVRFPKFIVAYSCNSVKYTAEGKNVLIGILDEIAEFKYDKAKALYTNLKATCTSRFPRFHKVVLISYLRDEFDFMNCFRGDTPVTTPTGTKLIRDIRKGDKVLSYNEEKQVYEESLVTSTFKYGGVKEIIKLNFGKFRKLWTTKSHKIYSNYGDVASGLITPAHKVFWSGQFTTNRDIKLPTPIGVDAEWELGYLKGVVVGDGHVAPLISQLTICAGKNKEHAEYLRALIERIFKGAHPTIRFKKKIYHTVCYSSEVCKFIQDMSLPTGNNPYSYGFIAGFYDADGSGSRNSCMNIANTNKPLLDTISKILYEGGVSTHFRSYKYSIRWGRLWFMVVPASEALKFLTLIRPVIKEKYGECQDIYVPRAPGIYKHINALQSMAATGKRVRTAKGLQGFTVYNIEVAPNNNFFASSILVHNSHYSEVDTMPFDLQKKYFRSKKCTWEVNLHRKREDFADAYHNDPEDSARRYENKIPSKIGAKFLKEPKHILAAVRPNSALPILSDHPEWTDCLMSETLAAWLKPFMTKEIYDLELEYMRTRSPELERMILAERERHMNGEYFIHIDLSGGAVDCAGLVMLHNYQHTPSQIGYYVDLAVQIRSNGVEINFEEIQNFVFKLQKMGFPITKITMDNWQSLGTKQAFEKAGIACEVLSVDKTPAPYTTFKDLTYQGLVNWALNSILMRELNELVVVNGKIDHPRDSAERQKTEGKKSGSKDVADAVAGALFTAVTINQGEGAVGASPSTDPDDQVDDMIDKLMGGK